MNPYLEHHARWVAVHNRLIVAIADDLAPRLRPHYYVEIESRVYLAEVEGADLVGRADVAVAGGPGAPERPVRPRVDSSILTVRVPVVEETNETYLEVREVDTERVVTVLEVLSPTNKRPGRGRDLYLGKRMEVLASRTHLVEIDLLRAGAPMPILDDRTSSDYRILVSRANQRPNADLYAFSVRQPIPVFPLPLKKNEQGPEVDIGRLLHALYERASYDLRIDYKREPEPPLAPQDAGWADELLREQGLR
jgi:hypothetical protein